ncbi:MAG: 50S ribosomal protein L9 [candidate division Zixibacteria bacterium]|nr:50S ribosomal protein L9 [candidate division Zixibacteria bacterium]
MKVILTDDVVNVGECGQTVKVKTGYARNFLIPHNLAIPATKGNLKAIDNVKKEKELRDKKRLRGAEKICSSLEKLSLTTELVVGEDDRVFGSVTSHAIADLIKEAGCEVERRWIELDEPIKALGVYTIKVKVEKDAVANVKLLVEKKA